MRNGIVVFLMILLLVLVQACASTDVGSLSSKGNQGIPPSQGNSLVSKITVDTSPERAASLRLTEEGNRLLDSGHYAKALTRLEQTLAVDSSNPYVYYFLGKAHFHLAHYRQSVEFLDVAESLLGNQSYWMGEVFSLQGKNFQALGLMDQAHSSYAKALRFNPKNQEAAVGLSHVQRKMKVPSVR